MLVALSIADWDWGADGVILHTFAIAIPATMATAVTLDLLARPGTLAMGERAGLVAAPRPFRAIRMRVAVLRRYRELVRLVRREGFGPFLSAAGREERTVTNPGVRLRLVLEEAGGVYVKLGQIAATRVDLIPPEISDELAKLQNRVPPEDTDAHPRGAGNRARRQRRAGVRRVRLGTARGGVDRSDASRAVADRRGRRREGPASRHR